MLDGMTHDATTLEARLVTLESKLALAEDLLDDLNRTIFRQQEHLDALTRELADVRRQQIMGSDPASAPLANERPPHY
jgi:SlyX protein